MPHGFDRLQHVRRAYRKHSEIVRQVFDGFLSPGLIGRMCEELNTIGEFRGLETGAQYTALIDALNGADIRYKWKADPELWETLYGEGDHYSVIVTPDGKYGLKTVGMGVRWMGLEEAVSEWQQRTQAVSRHFESHPRDIAEGRTPDSLTSCV